MNIRDWIESHPKGHRTQAISRLSGAAGVTPAAVRHWAAGLRRPKPEMAILIVAETRGQITIPEIYAKRPDIFGPAEGVANG